jgi:DnaJ-class molecular chaperone
MGVDREASADQIRKAFKKLAVKFHPDKNLDSVQSAKLKFQDISSAYEVLINGDKRAIYDRVGVDGFKDFEMTGHQ